MRFIFIILTFAVLPGMAQNLGFSLAENKGRVQIPIEVYNNLVVVPVVLNKQLPLKFVLDTGVRTAILTDKAFSDILRLPYVKKYSISAPGREKEVEAYITYGISLDLPGVKSAGHSMLVLEEDFLELRNYMGADVHGVLGYELFSRFVVHIDYEKKMLTLFTPEKFKPSKKYKVVRFKVEDTKPYITTTIQQADGSKAEVKLLIDSGASHALLLDPQSDSTITIPEKNIESVLGIGLGGVIEGRIGRIKSLELGEFTLKDVIARYPDPNTYMDSLKYSLAFRSGSIGGDLLNRFNVAFDFSTERLYLKKNNVFNKKFFYNMGGLTLKAKGSKLRNYEVTYVRPNSSAADAGVLAGDIIIRINGLSTNELSLHDVNGILNAKPGKKIYLDIDRKGQRLKKDFRLQSSI
ncbi:MAG TPA: aspartyl protease family protein [Cyclobacteriaceae bacterium]|nr:aspartyl protease family protein [Cyclobacteriaceae bacterium]